MISNLTKVILENGGSIHYLIIPSEYTGGMGICNPSVYKDGEDLLINLRNVEYVLYHSENEQKFQTRWGPLAYIHPEDDLRLKTVNFLCKLDPNNFNIIEQAKVDTSKLDVTPIWTFVGLEDARVIRWDNKLYLSGVRRDTTTNGEGRMELSEIENSKEISRVRINPPTYSYCEKNWMPIVDLPYHYVKWCNPTEVVSVNPETGEAKQVVLKAHNFSFTRDQRGGSQVISYKGYRVALLHEVELYKTEGGFKDAQYYHRFLVWDKDWNLVSYSEDFKFFTSNIEFACGMTEHNESMLISVGLQDNSAYIVNIPLTYFDELIKINKIIDFPSVYFITSERFVDRKLKMENELISYGIKYTPFVITQEQDNNSIIKGKYLHSVDNQARYVVMSHLRAIKHWYYNTDEKYGIFLEDDISFEPAKYWNFKWNSFINGLPNDWDCIQLCVLREFDNTISFRKRLWDDWSAGAYMITRRYAKKLIATYYPEEEFILEIPNSNLMPIPENIIYSLGNTYSTQLLIEHINAKSSHQDKEEDVKITSLEIMNKIEEWHNRASKSILEQWKATKRIIINDTHPVLKEFIYKPFDAKAIVFLAEYYYNQQQYAAALGFYLRITEWCNDIDLTYEALIKVARCLGKLGRRPASEETAFLNAITYQPQRPEAYLFISQYYEWYGKWTEMYTYASIGYANRANKKPTTIDIEYKGDYILLYEKALASNRLSRIEESRRLFTKLIKEDSAKLVGHYKSVVQDAVGRLGTVRERIYPYTNYSYYKFKYKFKGLEQITRNFSQAYQDLFILAVLDGKRNGTYLEIGSADPYINSNTALLEKQFGWTGLSVEIKADEVVKFKAQRNNPVLQADALKVNYVEALEQNKLPNIIDYLQLDCEPSSVTYEILTKIPFDKYKFAVITFEHDNYANIDESVRKKSRDFLISKGYELLVSDIGVNDFDNFEDWWIHPDLIDENIRNNMRNITSGTKNAEKYMLSETFDWGPFNRIPAIRNQVNHEISIADIYQKFKRVKEGDVVVDIGASVGPFSYLISKNKPSKIYCLEPHKEAFETLRKNLPQAICINSAISNERSPIKANYKYGDNEVLYTDYVNAISFDYFIRSNDIKEIDFLKIDCEGGEYDVFTKENYNYVVNNIRHIAAEFHLPLNNNLIKFKEFRDLYLKNYGEFKVFTCPDINIFDDITDSIFDDTFLDNYVEKNKLNSQLMIYMTKSNRKLANFPTVNFISLEDTPTRTESVQSLLEKNNIKYKAHIFKRFAEGDHNILGEGIYRLKIDSKGALVSHLKVLKNWYNTTEEEYAFVCEDDISLELVNYWNFTWDEFINNLPTDWEFVQLMQLKEYIVEFRLRTRDFFDWSAGAYIVKRDYVKRLLDRYYYNDDFNIHTGDMLPIVENVLFWGIGKAYTIPLFTEDYAKLGTADITRASTQVEQYYYNIHIDSYNSVVNWWKTNGCNLDIKYILTPPESGFNWGNNPYDYKLFFFREIFVNRIYERLASVYEGDVVMDIGANVGSFTYSILEKNPKHVYCIEPSKDFFQTLVENTNKDNITHINKAISDTDDDCRKLTEDVRIFNNEGDFYEAITFNKIVKDYNIEKIDFMKVDCEGGEYYIFTEDNYDYIMNNVKNIAGEWHLWGADDLKEKFKRFRDLYLKNHKDFLVLDLYNNNVTNSIFDDNFVDNFAKTSYISQFMVYMRN